MLSSAARALGALIVSLALAGCGGGGGGTAAPPVAGGPGTGGSTGGSVSGSALSISPNNLQYANPASPAQTFTVSSSAAGAAAPQIDGSTCAGIVTIAGGGGTLPQTYTVTPVAGSAGGGCTVVFISGTNAATIGIAVGGTVGYTGPLSVTAAPASLAFTAAGAAAQTFTVNAGGGAGPGTASVDAAACAGIATVTGSAATPPASFTVTPVGTGGCSLVVVDGFSSTTVPVTVGVTNTTAAVTVNPASVTFTSPTATPQSVSVGYQGYVGTVSVNQSACAGIAQFTIPNGSLPQTGTVTPLAAGSCTITFSATNAPAVNLAVTVQ